VKRDGREREPPAPITRDCLGRSSDRCSASEIREEI